MGVVDVVIIVVLVAALITGLVRGLLASLGSIIGLVAGGLAAFWAMPLVNSWVPSPLWRGLAVAAAGVGLLVLGAAIGSAIGSSLRRGVDRTPLKGVERFLGGVVSVVVVALAMTLVAPTIVASSSPGIATAIGSSRILQGINGLTPEPVEATIADIRTAIMGDDGLPRLGELLGPGTQTTSPPIALDDPELQVAAASVARISGVAYACGTGSSGTGFVVAPDRLVTNAHVVAGVDTPVVELPGREPREGRVVYFDPIDDLAVIAVDGLGGVPLAVTGAVEAGTAGAIQGYPNGGPFRSVSASVLSVGTVGVPDVYEMSVTDREIYALEAEVLPGNSGGPLLTDAGAVAGVVFARGENDSSRGYAMTSSELQPVLDVLGGMQDAVPTGDCAV